MQPPANQEQIDTGFRWLVAVSFISFESQPSWLLYSTYLCRIDVL